MRDKDYYKILQVDPSAEPEVITAAFRKLAQKYHPDRDKSPEATRRMQEINEAYEVLSDPIKRAQYDREQSSWSDRDEEEERRKREEAEARRRAEEEQQRRMQAEAERRHAEEERQRQEQAEAERRRAEHGRPRRHSYPQSESASSPTRSGIPLSSNPKLAFLAIAGIAGCVACVYLYFSITQYVDNLQNDLVSGGFTSITGENANYNLYSSGTYAIKIINRASKTKYVDVLFTIRFEDGFYCKSVEGTATIPANSTFKYDSVRTIDCHSTSAPQSTRNVVTECQLVVSGTNSESGPTGPGGGKNTQGYFGTQGYYGKDYIVQSYTKTVSNTSAADDETFLIPCSLSN